MTKIKTKDIQIPFEVIFNYFVESDDFIISLMTLLHEGHLYPDLKATYLERVKELFSKIEDVDPNYDCERNSSYLRFCMLFRTKELLSIK